MSEILLTFWNFVDSRGCLNGHGLCRLSPCPKNVLVEIINFPVHAPTPSVHDEHTHVKSLLWGGQALLCFDIVGHSYNKCIFQDGVWVVIAPTAGVVIALIAGGS